MLLSVMLWKGGFVDGIRDEWGRKCPIYQKSRKGQRVAKLTLEVEAISLNEGLEMALYIEEMWNEKINPGCGLEMVVSRSRSQGSGVLRR